MTAKDLKNALLQEAVQGKLVPQIASEGNARDLLEEIKKEKLSHGLDFANAKSGKKKSQKETALAGSNPCDITEDEIPFEIPENWCWCRLGELITFVGGYAYDSHSFIDKSDYQVLRLGNVKNGYLQLSAKPVFINAELAEKTNAFKCITNDILVTMTGTRLKRDYFFTTLVTKYDENLYINQRVGCLRPTKFIFANFLAWILKSKPILDYIFEFETGTANQGNLGSENIKTIPIPLPPLAEQKRIVAAIEKFMPLIEEYGKKETQLKAINEKIGTLTKKAILQEAVQGKLVPQIAAEGNAKDLLEEIKKEKAKLIKEGKIKKEKPLPEISDDEIPFDIPESWCWCKIEDITIPIGNKNNQIQSKEVLKDGKIPVVSQGQNLIDGYSNETEKAIKDIPVIMFGDHTRNVKYIDFPFIIGADGTKFFKPILCNKYYIYYLITFISLKLRNRGYARHYSLLKEEWLPLPPLVEQKRIVDAIEKLLPLCEKLGEK